MMLGTAQLGGCKLRPLGLWIDGLVDPEVSNLFDIQACLEGFRHWCGGDWP